MPRFMMPGLYGDLVVWLYVINSNTTLVIKLRFSVKTTSDNCTCLMSAFTFHFSPHLANIQLIQDTEEMGDIKGPY